MKVASLRVREVVAGTLPKRRKVKMLYPHICPDCIFLGSYEKTDLYFCYEHRLRTPAIIVRFGAGHYEEEETAIEAAKSDSLVLTESLAAPLSPLAEGLRRAALQDLTQWQPPYTVDRRQK
jgi:hypothetical protein